MDRGKMLVWVCSEIEEMIGSQFGMENVLFLYLEFCPYCTYIIVLYIFTNN